jgi:hypothetical protein
LTGLLAGILIGTGAGCTEGGGDGDITSGEGIVTGVTIGAGVASTVGDSSLSLHPVSKPIDNKHRLR